MQPQNICIGISTHIVRLVIEKGNLIIISNYSQQFDIYGSVILRRAKLLSKAIKIDVYHTLLYFAIYG